LRAALRKAIDGYRRDASAQRQRAAMEALADDEAFAPDPEAIPDDRLRLIFTCCHPALEEKTRIALTLRSLCGLTTPQVAAVFLDAEPTMGQRLSPRQGQDRRRADPVRSSQGPRTCPTG
jgi:predicted RNA polymerase sigma factor